MKFKQFLLGSFLATFLLVALSILSSQLPWGVKNVTPTVQGSHEIDQLTTETDQAMHLVLTDNSISFVSSRPISYHSMEKYISINMLLLFCAAIFLCYVLQSMQEDSLSKKLSIIGAFGLFSIFSIHLSYWNWWGFSNIYSFGVSFSTLFSLLFVSFILAKFVFKPTLHLNAN